MGRLAVYHNFNPSRKPYKLQIEEAERLGPDSSKYELIETLPS